MYETYQGPTRSIEVEVQKETGPPRIVPSLGRLPDVVSIVIHKCTNLYRPTVASKLKMDPYVAVYLVGKKRERKRTQPKMFGQSNPKFEKEILLPFEGEPMLIVQVFAKEIIRDEFIGEVPLDLLPVINSKSREWSGPVTVFGQQGTVVRGEVHVTLSMRGGDPYDPDYGAVLLEPMWPTLPESDGSSFSLHISWHGGAESYSD